MPPKTKTKKQSYNLLIALALVGIFGGVIALNTPTQYTPSLSLSDASQYNDILIRAKGKSGGEKLQLRIDGKALKTWTVTKRYKNYIYTPSTPITINTNLRAHFTNDQRNYDLYIDYIKVNGKRYYTEHKSTLTKGTWSKATRCAQGYKRSQALHCTGWAQYNVPRGTVVGTANTPTNDLPQVDEPSDIFTNELPRVDTPSNDVPVVQNNPLIIRARGARGAEEIRVRINNEQVAKYNLTTEFQRYIFSPQEGLVTNSIQVAHGNSSQPNAPETSYKVQVDYVEHNGIRYEGEAPETESAGTTRNCAKGLNTSATIYCGWGMFRFALPDGSRIGGGSSVDIPTNELPRIDIPTNDPTPVPEPSNNIILSQIQSAGGSAYSTTQDFGVDSHRDMRIYENGEELGPQGAREDLIGTRGEGRYALRNGILTFSTSDNTDPRTNGRVYTFTRGSGGATTGEPTNELPRVDVPTNDPAPAPTPAPKPIAANNQQTSCYNPWANGGRSLENRVRRLMNSPYKTGFGRNTTGGTQRLVTVTNPNATGSGSFASVIANARSGDYIIFDPAHSTYTNGCTGGGCTVPGSVTIDGSQPNGRHVTLQRNDRSTYNRSINFSSGNNILTNVFVDHNTLAAAVGVSNGRNYWLHEFEIHNPNDDALGIGNSSADVDNSADNVTISKYKVSGGAKGILMITGGQSCRNYPLDEFNAGDRNYGGYTPTDIAINQPRAHVTIIESDLAAATRNILNNGGYADIIGSYVHGSTENTITNHGGQTIFRCSYNDSRTVATRAIRAQDGGYSVGKNRSAARFCPEDAEIFLDNNIYRQKNFQAASSDPRINDPQSDIDTGVGSHMTNGRGNWNDPRSGRPSL